MLSKGVRLSAGQRVRLPSGLPPSVSLLVGHLCPPCFPPVSLCLRSPFLLVIVSTLSPFCLLLSPFLLRGANLCLAILSICLPALDCCVAVLYMFPSSGLLWVAVFASHLQSFTIVSQFWAAVSASALQSFICLQALGCMSLAILPLHLSPCVYICLPALDCCGRLCLAILCLPALDVASPSCRVFRF